MTAITKVATTGLLMALLAATMPVTLAATLSVRAQGGDGEPLANTVITLAGPETVPRMDSAQAVVRQQDLQFDPHVLVIRQHTDVVFPNLDDTRHQVFSFSAVKRFSTRLFGGEASPPIHFDQLGLVPVGCNIHDQMHAYIYVTNAQQFAVTDQAGRATFTDLPVGDYQLAAFHPWQRDPEASQRVNLTLATEPARWDVTLPSLRPDPREVDFQHNPLKPKYPFFRSN